MYNIRKNVMHARNDNETHYSGLIVGGLLGILLRKRLISKSILR
jgi:membrane associated rhomboid family serine protease